MANVEELLVKYIYDIEFDTAVENEGAITVQTPEWINSVVSEKYWEVLFAFGFEKETVRRHLKFIEDPHEKEAFFQFGIACLLNFIQCNFTGPDLPEETITFLNSELFSSIDFRKKLSVHYEDINVNTKFPALLLAADYVFEYCIVSLLVNTWWRSRLVFIHQKIIDTLCPPLLQKLELQYKELETCPLEGRVKALFEIEMAQCFLLFRSITRAKDLIIDASKTLGLEFQLVGKLGKRTRFQERDIAQLAVEASLEDREGVDRPRVVEYDVPANVLLKDDTRLDGIQFVEPIESIMFPNMEQKLFLAIINDMLVSKPIDELQLEEVQPFIDFILNQKNTWAVRTVALLQRCKLDERMKKTAERCCGQCEEIIASYKRESPEFLYRVADVFGTGLGPIWDVQRQYARLLFSCGCPRNSLDIYLEIQSWEDVINCYTFLRMRPKAADVIKQQLEKQPSVKMWCLLGDATDDVSCYEKAWLLSNKRSHIAQRHWGNFLYDHQKYEECIPHFSKSTSINPLQEKVWYRLGYAALSSENWSTCATAYRRYTNLEPESFEAWNNLAQAYIKLGNKRAAYVSLLEAVKCNYEHWRVWENLLYVSCDLSCFSEVIRSYNRIIDIKEKYVNVGVLSVLVYNVLNNSNDGQGLPASRFIQSARELFGRITASTPNDAGVWDLYASLAPTTYLRAQRLQHAFRSLCHTNGWFKEPVVCVKVLELCQKLGELANDEAIDAKDPIVNSIRLNINCAVTAAKKQNYEECNKLIENLIVARDKLLEKVKRGNEMRTK